MRARLLLIAAIVIAGGVGIGLGLSAHHAGPIGHAASLTPPGSSPIPIDSDDPVETPPPSGPDELLRPPSGPPARQLPAYAGPALSGPLPDLDPGLGSRGPRPTLHELQVTYQYGNPPVMFGPDVEGDWRLQRPDTLAVRGYASDISVRPGETLGISLAGLDQWADLDVFRIGLGDARAVAHVSHVPIPRGEQEETPRPSDGLVAERWPVATTLTIDHAWQSGVYLIKLTGASGGQSYVLFIVRPEHPKPFTVVIPTMTYLAYNDYGGTDLYGWPHHDPARAYAVSYDRPFSRQFGAGLFFRLDFPLVVWLEDHGYTPDYVADLDIARDPQLLTGVRTLAFSGHSEYWTGGMRDAVEAAARAGTNLAFFGANQAFWQVRMGPGETGTADRVMVCYKSAARDPLAASNPGAATVRFEEPPVNRPPSRLLGQKYGGIVVGVTPMRMGPGIAVFAPDIGLVPGQALPGLIGEEVDELHPAFHGIALGETPKTVVEHISPILVGTTLWINPLGDRVFDAGTFDYSWGLDPRYAAALPGFPAAAYTQLTARILKWLGA